jgi:hypothetical protein
MRTQDIFITSLLHLKDDPRSSPSAELGLTVGLQVNIQMRKKKEHTHNPKAKNCETCAEQEQTETQKAGKTLKRASTIQTNASTKMNPNQREQNYPKTKDPEQKDRSIQHSCLCM